MIDFLFSSIFLFKTNIFHNILAFNLTLYYKNILIIFTFNELQKWTSHFQLASKTNGVYASTFPHLYAKGHSILLSSYFYSFCIYLRLYPICNLFNLHLLQIFLQMIQTLITKYDNNEMTYHIVRNITYQNKGSYFLFCII